LQTDAETDAVLAAFQKTMRNFLDVQRATMLGYLNSPRVASSPAPVHNPSHEPARASEPIEVVAEREKNVGSGEKVVPPTNGHIDAAPSPDGGADRQMVESRLLAIVRERTGYPAEMLQLELDLEADLGIDSIKRVEILGTLRESLPPGRNGSESELMDQLSGARTLGAIVERVSRHIGPGSQQLDRAGVAPEASKRLTPSQNGHGSSSSGRSSAGRAASWSPIRRMLLEAVEAPISPASLARGGLILISDDCRGVAAAVSERLRVEGFRTVRIAHAQDARPEESGEKWRVDLGSPASIARFADQVRREGRIAGIVHALPLCDGKAAGLDPEVWGERIKREVRGLYLLAREFADDLARAARDGGAALVAATGMGGAFASAGSVPRDFFPGHGAIAGLVKTLAREWAGVRARVVDFDASEPCDRLAEWLADELLTADDCAEVGYLDGRRIAIEATVSDLSPGGGLGVSIRPGEPIVVTGGARGITSAVAEDLARRWQPTLLLIGTSPPPAEVDSPDVAGITLASALNARLLKRLARDRRIVAPAELERAYQALAREREIRATLARIRAAGTMVEYASVDVRDPAALGSILAAWRERYGPPVGLIHAAGVIQDKLLRDKTPESFDRVVGTKLEGALNLARLVDPASLRFTAFFSSVAGRFGNQGQADYAAANDALNKLAIWLDRRWGGRVVSMIWGPWSGVGMVSDLEGHLGRRGLGMIAPEEGRSRLAEELLAGTKGDVEVIVASDLGGLASKVEAALQP
jgi:NAD(P)-dependent dehydrogenase (short-subunit alcohol dehydrogenase family)/acyl carrier protein